MLFVSLRSAAVVALMVVSTGCAAGLRGDANLSAQGGQLSAGAQGRGSGWGNAQSGVGVGGGWYGSSGGQATAGGSVGGGVSGGVGGGASGGVGGGAQGRGAGQGGGAVGGGVAAAPWQPVFYGIPLAGAQDVVFVLDHSGSMSSTSSSLMAGGSMNPIAAMAAVGLQVMGTARNAQSFLPAARSTGGVFPLTALPTAAQQSKMDAAKSELIGALAALPDGTRFNIVFFNDSVAAYTPQLTVMSPGNRLNAMSFVQGIGADGSTAAVPALRTAYSSRPYRVVFLSDGLANTGGNRDQLLADARLEMRRGVRFDTIGVGPDQDAGMMRSLASESGGQWVQRLAAQGR